MTGQIKMFEEQVSESEAERLLKNLVEALQGAFISTWQSTHFWQNQLKEADEFLQQQEESRR